MKDRFYITTPIYYPNGEPHLGHIYTTTCADVLARYYRALGVPTHFLTGTDEHGIKMVKTAAEQNTTPRDLADKNAAVFEKLWPELGISNDDFIRTSSDRHRERATALFQKMLDASDIYLGSYEGWYDEGQEEFVTETEAKTTEYKSKVSGKPLTRYKEESYFFKLSKFAPQVLAHIEANPDFIQPEARRNEVVSKLKQGVDDLSISRASFDWGIPLPNDPKHVMYVWIDALSNYITALGYASDDNANYKNFWPADVHLIGKEILWFHSVYWPAMLMSAGEALPRCVFAHGWWTSEGKKMSKSLGNFIDLEKIRSIIQTHSIDGLRYYLLRAAPFGSDLDFSDAELNKSYGELGNVLGNLLNRVLKMIGKYRDGIVPDLGFNASEDSALKEAIEAFPSDLSVAYDRMELQRCVTLPIELARLANQYVDQTKPFSLAKQPEAAARLDTVLHLSARAVYFALVGLIPVLPTKAIEGLKQLGIDASNRPLESLLHDPIPAGTKVNEGQPLFPRIETP